MGIFDDFINTTDTAEGVPIAKAANPVEWSRLAQSIATSIVAIVTLGVSEAINNVADTSTALYGGLTEWVTGRLTGTVDQLTFGASEIWAINVQQFGLAAGPAVVLEVLAVLYVLSIGVQTMIEVAGGGD